jgi:hypothetical protein
LAEDAPPELRGQVRLCGFRVLSDHSSFLPKAGALAIVEKQRALVLVFSVPEAPGTFDLNAWPVGTCGRQLAHRSVTTTP